MFARFICRYVQVAILLSAACHNAYALSGWNGSIPTQFYHVKDSLSLKGYDTPEQACVAWEEEWRREHPNAPLENETFHSTGVSVWTFEQQFIDLPAFPPPGQALAMHVIVWTCQYAWNEKDYDGSIIEKHESVPLYAGCSTGDSDHYLQPYPQFCRPPEREQAQCKEGNPIYPSTGNKVQQEDDYIGVGAHPLEFSRTYRSRADATPANADFGKQWFHTWQQRVIKPFPSTESGEHVAVLRADGTIVVFKQTKSGYTPEKGNFDRLTEAIDSRGQTTGFTYVDATTDTKRQYSATGQLLKQTERNGWITTLTYSNANTPATVAPRSGLVLEVRNNFGRALQLQYDSRARISKLIDPAGTTTQYQYDGNDRLQTVTWPDAKIRTYVYEDATTPLALTGIVDENGVRFATFQYDSSGRAVSSEHAGGVAKITLSKNPDGTTKVTTGTGIERNYSFQRDGDRLLGLDLSAPCPECGANYQHVEYDTAGNVAKKVGFDNSVTATQYDSKGRILTQTKTVNGNVVKRIVVEWHPTYHLMTRASGAGRRMLFSYDGTGNLTHYEQWKTNDSTGALGFNAVTTDREVLRDTTYDAHNQPATVSEALFNLPKRTWVATYTQLGDYATIVDDENNKATVQAVDAHGHLLRGIADSGAVVEFTYTPRGFISTESYNGRVITFQRDGVGNEVKATIGSGITLDYIRNAAQELLDVLQNGKSLRKGPNGALPQAATTTAPLPSNTTQTTSVLERAWRWFIEVLKSIIPSAFAQWTQPVPVPVGPLEGRTGRPGAPVRPPVYDPADALTAPGFAAASKQPPDVQFWAQLSPLSDREVSCSKSGYPTPTFTLDTWIHILMAGHFELATVPGKSYFEFGTGIDQAFADEIIAKSSGGRPNGKGGEEYTAVDLGRVVGKEFGFRDTRAATVVVSTECNSRWNINEIITIFPGIPKGFNRSVP